MQYWQCRVHVGEEELDAILDHVVREEARRRGERRTAWWTVDTIHSIRNLGGECGLSLRLAQFTDHLRSRPLGSLLLWYGMICTG
jgi:hypothetical protein